MPDLRSLFDPEYLPGPDIDPGPAPVTPPTGYPTIDRDDPVADPVVDPLPGGQRGGGGGGIGGGVGAARPIINIPGAPRFNFGNFVPPDPRDIVNDPSFQFRRDQGTQAIERAAAAGGVLRTGGTLKDLGTYVSNFSGNEAQGAYDRALRTHGINLDIERSRFAPSMAYWQALANAEQASGLAQYNRGTIWDAPVRGGGSAPDIPPPPEDDSDVSYYRA